MLYTSPHKIKSPQHSQGRHRSDPVGGPRPERSGHGPPSVTQKQSQTDNHFLTNISFPPSKSYWGNKLSTHKGTACPGSTSPTERELGGITGTSFVS